MKRGIYETEYGNAAYVPGPMAKTAYDLDMVIQRNSVGSYSR